MMETIMTTRKDPLGTSWSVLYPVFEYTLNMTVAYMGEATQDFGTRTNAYKKHQDSRLSIIIINSSSGLSKDL